MKTFLATFLKGSLTKVSTALLVVIQSPTLIADAMNVSETFKTASQVPTTFGSVVASLGIIWGALRSSKNYFGK